jgi:hypothetical protein
VELIEVRAEQLSPVGPNSNNTKLTNTIPTVACRLKGNGFSVLFFRNSKSSSEVEHILRVGRRSRGMYSKCEVQKWGQKIACFHETLRCGYTPKDKLN